MSNIIQLDAHCRRVLGALMEKEQTTPDYYPLTLNALIAACNQTTNRDPVMSMQRFEVLRALHTMERVHLVQRETGPRVDRWSHLLVSEAYASPPRKAVLTVLLLRGAQTTGELRARTERMFRFESLAGIEAILEEFVSSDPPLVKEVPRKPGQKESRWVLNIDEGEVGEASLEPKGDTSAPSPSTLEERVERLEEQFADLLERIERLEAQEEGAVSEK